jgi:hypothetical protein
MWKNIINYLRYSGVSVIIALNPLWWKVLPWYRNETNDGWESADITFAFGFLGITIRIWIDDGSW